MKNLRVIFILIFCMFIQKSIVNANCQFYIRHQPDEDYSINNIPNFNDTTDFSMLYPPRIYDKRMILMLNYQLIDSVNFGKYKGKPISYVVKDNIDLNNFLYVEMIKPFGVSYYTFILYYKFNDTTVMGFSGTFKDGITLPVDKKEAVDSILTSTEYILTFFLLNVNAFKKEIDNAYEVYGTITKSELENCKRLYPKVFK